MNKIHIVTLNPALDIRFGKYYAGGKGINVHRALVNLGHEAKSYALLGGERGEQVYNLMISAGIPEEDIKFVQIRNKTRKNEIIQGDPEIKRHSDSPVIYDNEIADLVGMVDSNLGYGDYLVLSGSIPGGIDARIYNQLVGIAHQKRAKSLLDASQKEPLRFGLEQSPTITTPNQKEWEMVFGKQDNMKDFLAGIVKEYGIEYAIATLSERGAVMATAESFVEAVPPAVDVKCTVGCGDGFNAGFLIESDLAYAVACGTATAMEEGTETCKLENVLRINKQVLIKILNQTR